MYRFPHNMPIPTTKSFFIFFIVTSFAILPYAYAFLESQRTVDLTSVSYLPSTLRECVLATAFGLWLVSFASLLYCIHDQLPIPLLLCIPLSYLWLQTELATNHLLYPSRVIFNEPFAVVLRDVGAIHPLDSTCTAPATWVQLTGLGFDITPSDPEPNEGVGWKWIVKSAEKGSLESAVQKRFLTFRSFAASRMGLCTIPTSLGAVPLDVVTSDEQLFPSDAYHRLGAILLPGWLVGLVLYGVRLTYPSVAIPSDLSVWAKQTRRPRS